MSDFTFFWLLLFASIVAMAGRFIKLPYTITLVLAGLLVGYLNLLPNVRLEPQVLFAVFLPPLLFESGIHIHFPSLLKQWRIIVTLAIFGTLVSTAAVGYATSCLIGLPLLAALLFGAIISPTDPISVMSMFKSLGVNERLAMIVEAESLFNDGVAIVLFAMIQGFIASGNLSFNQIFFSFIATVLGGAGVGVLVGGVASRITREFDDHLLEITLTTVVAYGSYLAAEHIHVSGVIAVVAASLVAGNYGMTRGMSTTSRLAVLSFWEYVAFAVNSMVFLLIGIEMGNVPLNVNLLSVSIVICVVLAARAVSVYGLTALLNYAGNPVPMAWQHVLVWGGLRGALSMAMVLGLGSSLPERDLLITLAFGVVLFTLLGQGLTIAPLIHRLKLSSGTQSDSEYDLLQAEHISLTAAIADLENHAFRGKINAAVYRKNAEELVARRAMIEERFEEILLANPEMAGEEQRKMQAMIAVAQKSALIEAARSGYIEKKTADHLIRRLEPHITEK